LFSLARHLPAALHLAGVGQPSQGLNAFFVAMIISSLSVQEVLTHHSLL
jgi:hypothetical protein